MPGPAVGVAGPVGDLGQGPVSLVPVLDGCESVDRRPDHRVPEPYARADLDQPGAFRRRRIGGFDPQHPPGAPEERRVAERLRGRHEQEASRVAR